MSLENLFDFQKQELIAQKKMINAKNQWQTDPTDPTYLMEYVLKAIEDQEVATWRADIYKTAEKIDPDNSYYDYWMTAKLVRRHDENRCIHKIENLDDDSEYPSFATVEKWEIRDQEKYEQALQFIIQATNKKGIIKHGHNAQFSKLSNYKQMKEDGVMDKITMYSAGLEFLSDIDHSSLNMIGIVDIFDAKFYELSQSGTREEVRFWMDIHIKTIEHFLGEQSNLMEILVTNALFRPPLANMKAATIRVGMFDESKKLNHLITELDAMNKVVARSNHYTHEDKTTDQQYSRNSIIVEVSVDPILRQAERPHEIIIPSATPDRYSDHSLLSRIITFWCVILFSIISIGVWVFYFAKSKSMRSASMLALSSLRLSDGAIITIGGIIFPVATYLTINQSTTLGLSVREWSVISADGMLYSTQFLGMLLTCITLSSALLRWRLSVLLPKLFRKERILGWMLPALSLTAMILAGLSDKPADQLSWSIGIAFHSIVFLSWLIIAGIGSFNKKHKFESLVMSRGLISIYASLIVVFTGLYFYYEAQERHWVSKSEQYSFDRDNLGITAIEYVTSIQMRKELLEKLDLLR